MERDTPSTAAHRSKHGPRDREGQRRQTPADYIACRKRIAVERVMAGFNKWLEKKLAIILYTIEASEASDDTGGKTGSQSRDSSENMSGGASGRPKRQFRDDDDDDPNDISGGGDDNGQDRGGNKRAKKGK
jgi:hypothetical protein